MSKSEDLHGNARDKSKVALLLIDMISDFEFPDGEKLFKHALPMAKELLSLKKKLKNLVCRSFTLMIISEEKGKRNANFCSCLI